MDLEFYNSNAYRAYPFTTEPGLTLGAGVVSNNTVVDAGFLMGENSGFIHGTHTVYFKWLTVTFDDPGYTVHAAFRTTAPDMSTRDITGTVTTSGPWSGFLMVELVAMVGATERPDLATGWVVLNSSDIIDGIGGFINEPVVEPALIQSLCNTFVNTISLYNRDPITESGIPTTYSPVVTGVVGDVYFIDGYNTSVTVNEVSNLLTIDATPGAGLGYFCDWDFSAVNQTCSSLIAMIGKVKADSAGAVGFSGDNGIVITPTGDHELTVSLGNTDPFCT